MPKKLISVNEKKASAIKAEARRILSARGREREDLLLDSDNLPAVVPLIPAEELLFAIRGADREAALTILPHVRTSQLQTMIDLELWSKDRLRPERAAWWLTMMEECGDKTLVRWLRTMDSSELAVLLAPSVRASISEEGGDPDLDDREGETTFTLDGVHYFTASDKIADSMRKILTFLRIEAHAKYLNVIETMLTGFDAEKEEEAFEVRGVRLAERGFVSFDEAQKIYGSVSPAKFQNLVKRVEAPSMMGDDPATALEQYPVPVETSGPRLKVLLDRIAGTDAAASVAGQIAVLTHKVVSADGMDAGESKSYYVAGRKAAGFISIGLETLAGSDEERMLDLLQSNWVEHLFRVGWWRIEKASKKAREMLKKGWPEGRMERLLILDPSLAEPLGGLLRKRPKHHHKNQGEGEFREFESLAEIEEAERNVDKAGFVGSFILKAVDFSLRDLKRASVSVEDDNLKGSTVFLTALVNAALGKGFHFGPIKREDAVKGLAKLWDRKEPPRRVRPEFRNAALDWAGGVTELEDEEVGYFAEFLDETISLLEDEYGHLSETEIPDPRFIKGIWIS